MRARGGWALALCALSACTEPKRRVDWGEPSSDARDRAASPSSQSSASPSVAPPAGSALASGAKPPVVSLSNDHLDVEGTPAGDIKEIVDGGSMRRVDELFNDLKQRREDWKEQRPGTPFPGVAGVRAAPDTSAIALKSVMQTMAFAGYPNLALQIVGAPDIYDVEMQVPGPPNSFGEEPPAPKAVMNVTAQKDGRATLVWKVGSMILETSELAAGELGGVCKSLEKENRATYVILNFDDALTPKDLAAPLEALRGCEGMTVRLAIR